MEQGLGLVGAGVEGFSYSRQWGIMKNVTPEDDVVNGDVTLARDVDSGSNDNHPRVASLGSNYRDLQSLPAEQILVQKLLSITLQVTNSMI